jgi:hypothetical protein
MEVAGSSETLINIYQTTRCHIPENSNPHHSDVCFRIMTRGNTSWSMCVSSWTSSRRTTLACAMLTTRDRGYEFGTWCNSQGITDWGCLKEEVTAGWRTLHNEDLHNLYFSQNIIRLIKSRGIRMDRTCSMHGKMRTGSKFFSQRTWREETTSET